MNTIQFYLVSLFVVTSLMVTVATADECEDDGDCIDLWLRGHSSYSEDKCCQGKCREHCPIDVFLWVLVVIIIPIVCCLLCAGAIFLVIYLMTTAANEGVKRNGEVAQPHLYPPAATYSAYPPYTATNYGFDPPSYSQNSAPETDGKL